MFPSKAIRTIRTLATSISLLLAVIGYGQVDNVYVYGTVKDYTTSKKLDGITVTVYKNGGKLAKIKGT